MGSGTLYMIGNAHIDPVWLWQWSEGYQETLATFRSALERMKEYPDFKFTASSAALYQWVEENDPTMFAEIQQRVSEDRWELAGGWWIEPDCNIPGGESFVRQGLYGQRFFQSRFGKTANLGYNVDSFGHCGTLPQILKKSRLQGYVFMRPAPHEKDLPARVFWWESDDGSCLLTLRLPGGYGTWSDDIGAHIDYCASEIQYPLKQMACFYGVGNHGGGPTIANIECIHQLQQKPKSPTLLFGTLKDFFQAIQSQQFLLPVVHEDLQHHASGCYSAHSSIKLNMRLVENLLLTTEKLSTAAACMVGAEPLENLTRAWKNLLFNQFHDILAGTSLEGAYEDTFNQLGESKAIAGRNLNHAIQSIAARINIEQQPGTFPLVVFNPNTWSYKTIVELEIWGLNGDEVIIDYQGRLQALQFIQSHATTTFRSRFCFVADLPALGYTSYRVIPPTRSDRESIKQTINQTADLFGTETSIENDFLRLTIDPQSGCVQSLFDKKRCWETFSLPAAKAVVLDDPSDTWSHGIFKFDQVIGEFTADRVSLVESGPVQMTLRTESHFGTSALRQDFTLYQGQDYVRVSIWIDWHEHHKMLKIRFPINIISPQATYEIPYGYIHRPTDGIEYPGQCWIDLSGTAGQDGKSVGFSLLNDAKYSYDIQGNDIGMTVLRSPIYAHHDPAVPNPARHYSYMDQGMQHFSYILYPHEGSWKTSNTVKYAMNQTALGMQVSSHPGNLPGSTSFIAVDKENIIVTVLKVAEDSGGWVLRAFETAGIPTSTTIKLPYLNRQVDIHFNVCEIKTIFIPKDLNLPVTETDLLEWPAHE
jgi:alpha-mannosidase